MRSYYLALVSIALLCSCNKNEEKKSELPSSQLAENLNQKDKEIAKLKLELEKEKQAKEQKLQEPLPKQPIVVTQKEAPKEEVRVPQKEGMEPEVAQEEAKESESEAAPTHKEPPDPNSFTLDLKGQLDRIDAEIDAREYKLPLSDIDYRDAKILNMDILKLLVFVFPKDVLDFAKRADLNKSIKYEHLKKNAEPYAGKPWRFTGRILEISEKSNPELTVARISLDYYGNYPIYVVGRFNTPFLTGNTVEVVGYLAGNYSYESQAGWNITVPAIAALAIVKYESINKLKNLHAKDPVETPISKKE